MRQLTALLSLASLFWFSSSGLAELKDSPVVKSQVADSSADAISPILRLLTKEFSLRHQLNTIQEGISQPRLDQASVVRLQYQFAPLFRQWQDVVRELTVKLNTFEQSANSLTNHMNPAQLNMLREALLKLPLDSHNSYKFKIYPKVAADTGWKGDMLRDQLNLDSVKNVFVALFGNLPGPVPEQLPQLQVILPPTN